ncbi:hypothetical protein RQP46_002713 [Phenoliferia psychrophenolica]
MAVAAAAATAAATTAAICYVDAKLGLGRDLGRLGQLVQAKRALAKSNAQDRNSLYYHFEDQAAKSADREAYRCDDQSLTWREVELRKALVHCIKTVNAKLVLFDASLSEPITEIVSALDPSSTTLVRWADSFSPISIRDQSPPGAITLDAATLHNFPTTRFGDEHRAGMQWLDPAVLIFTSAKPTLLEAVLAVATSWLSGSTVIIGRKFSATKFWDEARAADANVIQYVGEVLRYLLAAPPSPLDKQHNVRLAYGPDVWNKFRNRFGVQVIAEFFTSTEGNTSLFNYNANDLGAGAVGHGGWLAKVLLRKDVAILRVDSETEEPARTPEGFCIRADDDESGELVSRIVADSPHQSFAGYYGNGKATEKKILRDVFEKGDLFFRTGDLLKRDSNGYTWFADRLGDTFRWRSENVATTEVQHALAAVVHESNVYGVLVPNHDGQAGCVALAQDTQPDLVALAKQVVTSLPKYAQPLFVRLVKSVDPTVVEDPLYWLQKSAYVPFGHKEWERLKNGNVKL